MKDEWNLDVLKLNHDSPETFTQFVWEHDQRPSMTYVIFERFLSYIFLTLIAINLLILPVKIAKYYLFFDYWTAILIDIALLPPLGHWKKSYSDYEGWDKLHWTAKINWMFYSAALPAGVVGAISYWIFLFKSYPDPYLMVMNTVPPALIMLTAVITAIPLRIVHFVFYVAIFMTYVLFTAIYQSKKGRGPDGSVYIYSCLDWRYADKDLLTIFGGLGLGLIVYLIFCLISMAKFKSRMNEEQE